MIQRPVILFSGKGGVGKTTCSAAFAACSASEGRKTLIMTSDMTPSLSDIFEQEIGDSIKTIDRNLDAIEISHESILERWKKKFGPDFHDILSHLIDVEGLDGESRHQMLDYIGSAPSLREETMLDLIADIAESKNYECIVWDTAPAGETLNLINMPGIIRKHLKAGAKVYECLDRIGRQITGKRSIADIMDEWARLSERLASFVRQRVAFLIVANPESLVVRQAQRILKTLRDYDVHILGMIINRVIEHPDSDSLREMKNIQNGHRAELKRLAGEMPVVEFPLSIKELKGIKALRETGKRLFRSFPLV